MKTHPQPAQPAPCAHTPGPFYASWQPFNSFGGISACQIRDETGDVIARCNPHTPHSIALANARLIAAAPDLLAALGALLESYAAYIDIDGVTNADIAEPVAAARAAIARARKGDA